MKQQAKIKRVVKMSEIREEALQQGKRAHGEKRGRLVPRPVPDNQTEQWKSKQLVSESTRNKIEREMQRRREFN